MAIIVIRNGKTLYRDIRENITINNFGENIAINDIIEISHRPIIKYYILRSDWSVFGSLLFGLELTDSSGERFLLFCSPILNMRYNTSETSWTILQMSTAGRKNISSNY